MVFTTLMKILVTVLALFAFQQAIYHPGHMAPGISSSNANAGLLTADYLKMPPFNLMFAPKVEQYSEVNCQDGTLNFNPFSYLPWLPFQDTGTAVAVVEASGSRDWFFGAWWKWIKDGAEDALSCLTGLKYKILVMADDISTEAQNIMTSSGHQAKWLAETTVDMSKYCYNVTQEKLTWMANESINIVMNIGPALDVVASKIPTQIMFVKSEMLQYQYQMANATQLLALNCNMYVKVFLSKSYDNISRAVLYWKCVALKVVDTLIDNMGALLWIGLLALLACSIERAVTGEFWWVGRFIPESWYILCGLDIIDTDVFEFQARQV